MSAIDKYKSSKTFTNTIDQLLFVFDEVIRLLYQTKLAIEKKDYETKHHIISKVTNILDILKIGFVIEQKDNQLNNLVSNFYDSISHSIFIINLNNNSKELLEIINSISLVKKSIINARKNLTK